MARVVKFPMPYDAVVRFECPNGHRAGWEIMATQHHGGGCFMTLVCRGRDCSYATTGEFIVNTNTVPIETDA